MNLQSLEEVIDFYKNMNKSTHTQIYNIFNYNAKHYNNGILEKQFNTGIGMGELPFSWQLVSIGKRNAFEF